MISADGSDGRDSRAPAERGCCSGAFPGTAGIRARSRSDWSSMPSPARCQDGWRRRDQGKRWILATNFVGVNRPDATIHTRSLCLEEVGSPMLGSLFVLQVVFNSFLVTLFLYH